jgi:hypothetical protein
VNFTEINKRRRIYWSQTWCKRKGHAWRIDYHSLPAFNTIANVELIARSLNFRKQTLNGLRRNVVHRQVASRSLFLTKLNLRNLLWRWWYGDFELSLSHLILIRHHHLNLYLVKCVDQMKKEKYYIPMVNQNFARKVQVEAGNGTMYCPATRIRWFFENCWYFKCFKSCHFSIVCLLDIEDSGPCHGMDLGLQFVTSGPQLVVIAKLFQETEGKGEGFLFRTLPHSCHIYLDLSIRLKKVNGFLSFSHWKLRVFLCFSHGFFPTASRHVKIIT